MSDFDDINVPDGVDLKKAGQLIKWIVKEENENDKTRKLDDSEMIQKIGKRIKDDAKCL